MKKIIIFLSLFLKPVKQRKGLIGYVNWTNINVFFSLTITIISIVVPLLVYNLLDTFTINLKNTARGLSADFVVLNLDQSKKQKILNVVKYGYDVDKIFHSQMVEQDIVFHGLNSDREKITLVEAKVAIRSFDPNNTYTFQNRFSSNLREDFKPKFLTDKYRRSIQGIAAVLDASTLIELFEAPDVFNKFVLDIKGKPEWSNSVFSIAGILKSSLLGDGTRLLNIPKKEFEQLFGNENTQALEFFLDDNENPDSIVAELKTQFPEITAFSWKKNNPNLAAFIATSTILKYLLFSLCIMNAIISITANLFILITKRKKQISVLRAIGGNGDLISHSFFGISLFIATTGFTLALAVYFLLQMFLQPIYEGFLLAFIIDGGTYYHSYSTPFLGVLYIFVVILFVISSFYPARKCASINIIDGLKED